MSQTGLVTDRRLLKHDIAGHPEQPDRLTAILNRFEQTGILPGLKAIPSLRASDEQLMLVHPIEYIQLVEREVAAGRDHLSTGDTNINRKSAEAARLAAGCAISAVDAVFAGEINNVFCAVRPPGHHASQSRGMGFCLFNNAAIAARYAQRTYGCEHLLIVDWDVHHGNGTQDIFYQDGSVLFFSTHQSPWYPGTGASSESGEGHGALTTINCPLPAGSGRTAVLQAFQERLLPAIAGFAPDLVVLSAGFDSRKDDPLGQFLLTDDDFRDLTSMMMAVADKYCKGRLVSLLEGGYDLDGLALAAEAHVRTLAGAPKT